MMGTNVNTPFFKNPHQNSGTVPTGCVHTWCLSTSAQAPAQNGAVLTLRESVPSSVPEYKVETLYYSNSGLGT